MDDLRLVGNINGVWASLSLRLDGSDATGQLRVHGGPPTEFSGVLRSGSIRASLSADVPTLLIGTFDGLVFSGTIQIDGTSTPCSFEVVKSVALAEDGRNAEPPARPNPPSQIPPKSPPPTNAVAQPARRLVESRGAFDSPGHAAAVIAGIAVGIGLGDLPYGYYMLLRLGLCVMSLFLLTSANLALEHWLRWVLIGFAVLYNPLIPIPLGDKSIWMVLNIATVGCFWIAANRSGKRR